MSRLARLAGLSVIVAIAYGCELPSPPHSIRTPTPAIATPISPVASPTPQNQQTQPSTAISLTPPSTTSLKAAIQSSLAETAIPPLPQNQSPFYLTKVPPVKPLQTLSLPLTVPGTLGSPNSFTSLAKEVEISGVIQLGQSLNAIIRTPNEDDYRFVTEGEFLADGQVLMKRIEMNSNRQPIVILEENGLEVPRTINLSGQSDPNRYPYP